MVTVTRDIAMYHDGEFYHVSLKNKDGTLLRCRANGKCKTWKTRPKEYELPVKYGLRECFYISHTNDMEWQITDEDYKRVQRKLLCIRLGVNFDVPNAILHDIALDNGIEWEG